jgi:peptidoglycan-associated lipoprotein
MPFSSRVRCAAAVLALTTALGLAGCAKNPADELTEGLGASGGGGRNNGRGGVERGGLGAPGSAREFASRIGDRVFFDSDSTELSAEAQATLDKQAEWLNQYPRYNFALEGHADERGTREYNFALGARRAEAAKNYLISRGVAASRIRTASFGKERPVATCDDISCWSQNRRAVTVLSGGNS